ncbi:Putative F-box/LRR-repeat protein At3g18150 [Linum perenne]
MAAATRTNKGIESATNENEGVDCISELPDEIIHEVLRRIWSPANAARTTVLSRRWRSVWSCYPVVEYSHSDLQRSTVKKRLENFRKFVEATMERVSRHSELRFKTLNISLQGKSVNYSSLLKQLVIFAMKRKIKRIFVDCENSGDLFEALEVESGDKSIDLTGMEFVLDDDSYFLPFLASLQILRLCDISARLLTSLIAKCPLLKTLEIGNVIDLKKLHISDFIDLKTLKIPSCEEIEIEAPGLQNLHFSFLGRKVVQKIELRAPQNDEEAETFNSTGQGIQVVGST